MGIWSDEVLPMRRKSSNTDDAHDDPRLDEDADAQVIHHFPQRRSARHEDDDGNSTSINHAHHHRRGGRGGRQHNQHDPPPPTQLLKRKMGDHQRSKALAQLRTQAGYAPETVAGHVVYCGNALTMRQRKALLYDKSYRNQMLEAVKQGKCMLPPASPRR